MLRISKNCNPCHLCDIFLLKKYSDIGKRSPCTVHKSRSAIKEHLRLGVVRGTVMGGRDNELYGGRLWVVPGIVMEVV